MLPLTGLGNLLLFFFLALSLWCQYIALLILAARCPVYCVWLHSLRAFKKKNACTFLRQHGMAWHLSQRLFFYAGWISPTLLFETNSGGGSRFQGLLLWFCPQRWGGVWSNCGVCAACIMLISTHSNTIPVHYLTSIATHSRIQTPCIYLRCERVEH